MPLLRTVILKGLVASLLAAGATAYAGEQQGTITALYVRDSDGLIYFFMTGTHSSRPACAGNTYWMLRDENTDRAKRQYAALLAAYAAGKTIYVSGAGTCTRWTDGEDVDAIRLDP